MNSKSNSTRTIRRSALWIALLGLLLPSYGAAQVAEMPEAEADEIARGADELRAQLDVRDRDLVDTALVFTNISHSPARVACHAFNADGEPVGRIRMHVPAGGLRFALASDLSHGQDFVGHVTCKTIPRVRATAVLLAPQAMTDLSVQHVRRLGTVLFPAVATY